MSNPTRIRPSQLLFTPSRRFGGRIPSSRPISLSQRRDLTTGASLLLRHDQNPKTCTASFPKKIVAITQERRRSSYITAATTTNAAAVEDVEDLSKNEKKEQDEEKRKDFIKKVYYKLAAQFLFTGLVYAVYKMMAGHTPNPSPSFYGCSYLLILFGLFHTLLEPKWKSTNCFYLGLYSLATTLLLGRDLADLNGKAMLGPGTATLLIVTLLTRLTFWEPEKRRRLLKYLELMFLIIYPFRFIFGYFKINTANLISRAVFNGPNTLLSSWYVLRQSEMLLKVSGDEKDEDYNYDEHSVASVQLFAFIANLFWSLMWWIGALGAFMV